MTAADVARMLERGRYRYAQDELRLQEEIAAHFERSGVAFEREVKLSPTDRIDFLVGTVGVEVKVKGSRSSVIRQLGRYAEHERIAELVLFTTRSQILVPRSLGGKPIARAVYRSF